MAKKRVLSGIQPSGIIHIGNYLGALKNWVELQQEMECFFCIVDLHAITVSYEPAELPKRVIDAVAAYVAAGLDPERSTIFVQSHVPEHARLCWYLQCITPLGWLERMTQYKDKSQRQSSEGLFTGLLTYPILMASDILIYKADTVPVGEDQVQHIELTRDIARTFNHRFGQLFPEPRPLLGKAARVMSLSDPTSKMSKSIPGSYVAITDEPDEIRKKIRRAVTDVGPRGDEMSPGVRNLLMLVEAFAGEDVYKRMLADYDAGTLRYSELKENLAEAMVTQLAPLRERYLDLIARPAELKAIVARGAERARSVAAQTLAEVEARMGFGE
ncbi:MAG TPA: tryptophan--tRNA ligase [Limnochordia bacterium]|nr:tryptophan--tRNA ligase [Limnochordia bacterium]